jgi:hypothetical protein
MQIFVIAGADSPDEKTVKEAKYRRTAIPWSARKMTPVMA